MLLADLRIAIRHLRKSPGFAATAVLMLALGIGATTAIFSIVEGVLLRPLPFPHSEQLVSLSDVLQGTSIGADGLPRVTAPDIVANTRDTHSFESLGGYQTVTFELTGVGEPAQIYASRLTGGVFPTLQVAPIMGRIFTQQEDDQSQQVAVVSYGLWRSRMHGDVHVLGSKILLDRKPYVIIGVMPPAFDFPLLPGRLDHSELWVPMSFEPQELHGAGAANWSFAMVGRLKPGVTAEQARQDAQRVAQETMSAYPPFMASLHILAVVRSLREQTVAQARELIRILFLATAVVLLIVCANLAGLLLVRAIRRRREIAMRMALGAGKLALLRQSVLESLVLSVSGGLLGLVLAAIGLRAGISQLPETLPRVIEIGLDLPIVAFALALSVLTGLACGLIPAFAAWRTSVNDTLKEGGRSGSTGGHAWLRSSLVVGEIATALVLLAACGLLLRSFDKMRSVDLGFRSDHVLTATYALPEKQYPTQAAVNEFNQEFIRRVQQVPGVKAAGLTSFLPASGAISAGGFVVEGYAPAQGPVMAFSTEVQTEGDYFQAMGIALLAGRFFTPADNADGQLVAMVNHKLAEHYWPATDPIGKRLRIGTPEAPTPWLTVIGEVADVKEDSPDVPNKEQLYQPIEQYPKSLASLASPSILIGNTGFITLRTEQDPEQSANTLRAAVGSIDPQLPLTQIQSMESVISDSEAPRRFNTTLISFFAITALVLAALGIYSVVAFSAALRVQEMAIRMALGSQRSGILGLVVLSAVKLGFAGCAVGLAGVAATAHLLDSLLFSVSRFDPLVLALAAVFVLALALAASVLPALRAAAIDPITALRAE